MSNSSKDLPDISFKPETCDPTLAFVEAHRPDKHIDAVIKYIPVDTLERLDWLVITGQVGSPDHAGIVLQHLSGETITTDTIKYYFAREGPRLVEARKEYIRELQARGKDDWENLAQSPVHARYGKLAVTLSAKLEGKLMRDVAMDMELDQIKAYARTIKEIQAIDVVLQAKNGITENAQRKREANEHIDKLVGGFVDRIAEFQKSKEPADEEPGHEEDSFDRMNQAGQIIENVVLEEQE